MDADDLLPRKRDNAADALAREDLDPLSVEELDARIALLHTEIERCRARKAQATSHRAHADNLFKK